MRLIVRNRQLMHIWNVQDYIKQTQANLQRQDNQKFISMQNVFTKLYLRHLKEQEKLQIQQEKLNSIMVLGQMPARAIADYFHQKSKTYN